MTERKVVIELQDVRRNFLVGEETVHALRGVSFKIYEGEFVTIMGKSGSGKSTLLNQLGCLDTPSSGEYILDGVPVRTMSRSQRAVLRNRKIGFIIQNYNLLAKTGRPPLPQVEPDVGRTDAACRHCPCLGEQSSSDTRRRGNRKPRHKDIV